MELTRNQFEILARLAEQSEPAAIAALAEVLQLDQSQVMGACTTLAEQGLLTLSEAAFEELSLGAEGCKFVDRPLPERVVLRVLRDQGGACKLTEVPDHCEFDASQVGQSLRWLHQRGWARKDRDRLVLADAAPADDDARTADELLLAALRDGRIARRDELEAEGVDVVAALELLAKRRGFLNIRNRTDRRTAISPAGRELLASGVQAKKRVTRLTPEMLSDGSWREVEPAPYDVTLAAKKLYPGKEHAFQRTIDKVRGVFLEMGFTEVASPWIESSFWDFDALFQPQDHPARDMQDTFYIARPDRSEIPDRALVEQVRQTHENGGDTGSTGWGYRWSEELAHRPVLRTHTTAATVRALAAHQAGEPGKYFVVGPVYRRETVDFKHLPMFHQVDGIIVDRHSSLSTLLGTLSAFYRKMGFEKVRFRPSFFPYTEPSVEADLWLEQRGEWVEMGGSGIFRPEVTLPLGVSDRVLAWGLGLERLAMMIHNLKSIGELYFAHMPWLRETPVGRT